MFICVSAEIALELFFPLLFFEVTIYAWDLNQTFLQSHTSLSKSNHAGSVCTDLFRI